VFLSGSPSYRRNPSASVAIAKGQPVTSRLDRLSAAARLTTPELHDLATHTAALIVEPEPPPEPPKNPNRLVRRSFEPPANRKTTIRTLSGSPRRLGTLSLSIFGRAKAVIFQKKIIRQRGGQRTYGGKRACTEARFVHSTGTRVSGSWFVLFPTFW
jgi:hypothetical protein